MEKTAVEKAAIREKAMDKMEAIRQRHSVRRYLEKRIGADVVRELQKEIEACNTSSGLHIQLVTDEPGAFDSFMAHYGKFRGVTDYIALVGKKGDGLDESVGYHGERLVLKAQQLGLNTCWVAMTYSKRKTRCVVGRDEKLACMLALGYGENAGVAHKSKAMGEVCRCEGEMPEWFRNGMEAALLAPTAMGQQKFMIELKGGKVSARAMGGFYSKIDLGIVKYHFEIGAGVEHVEWA